jgi:hypothetical protein
MMRHNRLHTSVPRLFLAATLSLMVVEAIAADRAQRERAFRRKTRPLVMKYCADCHAGDAAEGGLSFDRYTNLRDVLVGREQWWKVLGKLQVRAMPPEDAEQPTAEERKFLVEWIDDAIHNIDCQHDAEPGHVTIRRLNRVEYRNTIRDLLDVDYEPTDEFPADDIGYGFDNIGDVLSLPPILMEKYLEAAEEITDRAMVTTGLGIPVVLQEQGSNFKGYGKDRGGTRILVSRGTTHIDFVAQEPGQYAIEVTAFAHQAGPEPAKMTLGFDGTEVKTFEVKATDDSPGIYKSKGRAKKGKHRIELTFVNDYYKPDDPDPNNRDRNLIITHLEVRGPLDAKPKDLPESHRRIFFVKPSDDLPRKKAARQVLERFATRAYRRPATSNELDRLLRLVEFAREGGSNFEASIQLAAQAVLVSPHFLFRIEENPPRGATERKLNDYELAARLSYFLWSSMPDDELLKHAGDGTLRRGDNLPQQVRRMLKDPKSQALVDNFAAQWLQLRKFDEMTPSERHFPAFDNNLRRDMRTETEMFFAEIMRGDRNIAELLVANYTFVNERLARHYGIPNVKGEQFQRVSLTGSPRGGLMTHGSILTVTSNPTRTSPVKRGRWILENLLGEPPPPPPPDVPELIDEGQELTGTLREQMEQHRANPNCAVCHEQMDALGFALENFDAVGAWRLFDGEHEIDPSGELPGGVKFNGPAELATVLRERRQDKFVGCLTEKMLTYALGRGLEYYDQCAVDTITKELAEEDYRFSALVLAIVNSEPFQKQGAKRSEE